MELAILHSVVNSKWCLPHYVTYTTADLKHMSNDEIYDKAML